MQKRLDRVYNVHIIDKLFLGEVSNFKSVLYCYDVKHARSILLNMRRQRCFRNKNGFSYFLKTVKMTTLCYLFIVSAHFKLFSIETAMWNL